MRKYGTPSPMLLAHIQRKRLQKRRAFTESSERERRFREAIHNLPIPIGMADRQGNVLAYNRKFSELYGYILDDVSSIDAWCELAYPDSGYRHWAKAQWEQDVEQALLANEATTPREYRITCKDGSQRDVEIIARPVGDLLITSFLDVTERKQMESVLRENEAIFSSFLEHSPVYVFFKDKNIRSLRLSRNYEQMLGVPLSAALGKTMDELFPSELAKSMVADDLRILNEGQRVQVIEEFNGRVYETTKFSVFRDGQPEMLAGFTLDITDRMRAEQALRENNQFVNSLLRAIPIAVFFKDREGRYLGCNDVFTRITGASADTLRGKTVHELWPGELADVYHRKDLELMQNREHQEYEFKLRDKDGQLRSVLYAKDVFLDASGQVAGMVGAFLDITERKRAEDELRESEKRFRVLFENAGAGVAQGDTNTRRFIEVNQKYCEMLGYTRQEMEGLDFVEITYPEDLPKNLDLLEQLKRGEIREFTMEKRYIRKDGSVVWVLLTVSPLWNPGEPPSTHITVVHDITEQKRAEYSLRYSEAQVRKLNAELEQRVAERTFQLEVANKELEAFAYSVSHDLRAPLRAIDGFSRILMNEHADELSTEARELLDKVRSANDSMSQVVDALLRLSRMTRAEIHREPVDLIPLARNILESLSREQPEREVEWLVAEQAIADGDSRLLRVVLENLLGNAWKFTSKTEQARIEFGVENRNGEPIYFVSDNGAGFDPRYADKLFGAFQRLHRSDEFEGTGIGLATVQRIIHRHGGRIWAEGEPGKGATFYFTLGEIRAS